MVVLPPGTLLQLMYLRERLRLRSPGVFVEIGPGSGEITRLLLSLGWSGRSYDLEEDTVLALRARFAKEIDEQRFLALNEDFLVSGTVGKADLVISCMVMEHLDDGAESVFLRQATDCLNPNGVMMSVVPASPAHGGIEDDIAGHCRRYTRDAVQQLAAANRWSIQHVAGLTFPVSNFLLPVSNFLVNRSERQKLSLTALERTKLSGRRQVAYKTHFPPLLSLLLNEITMYPLHVLQKLFRGSQHALVLFFEAQPMPAVVQGGGY